MWNSMRMYNVQCLQYRWIFLMDSKFVRAVESHIYDVTLSTTYVYGFNIQKCDQICKRVLYTHPITQLLFDLQL